jgi:uncharacterized damage-inducible protein DinB
MSIIPMFLKELEYEAHTTRKFLAAVPEEKFSWKPHEKSMNIQQLATHIAELPGWVSFALATDELDFAKNHYEPAVVKSTSELLVAFDKAYDEGKAALSASNNKELEKIWTMRNAETIYLSITKAEMIRISISQTIHHRAQLGVFFRLLGIEVPPSYGPTADFPNAY